MERLRLENQVVYRETHITGEYIISCMLFFLTSNAGRTPCIYWAS